MRHSVVPDAESVFFSHDYHDDDDGDDDGADVAHWELMVLGYAWNGRLREAMELFRQWRRGQRKSGGAITRVIGACARLALARLVRECHTRTVRALAPDLQLEAALVDAYCKCDHEDWAPRMFATCSWRGDLVTCTAMAAGCAASGQAAKALTVLEEMVAAATAPDHVAAAAALSACCHVGRVHQGIDLFVRMVNKAVDLAEVAGANGRSLAHGEAVLGRLAAERIFEEERENVGNYVVMSNIYAAAVDWEGVEAVRWLVKGRALTKPPGCSWLELEKSTHVFVEMMWPTRRGPTSTARSLSLTYRSGSPLLMTMSFC
ncbi:putative pentatricopeptide repeat-containing protein At5g08490 [Wolffia australiana]